MAIRPATAPTLAKDVGLAFTDQILQCTELAAEEEALPDDILYKPPAELYDKVVCSRCEKKLLEMDLASHMNAHSSEVIPGFLFLGSMQSAHNKKELIVRTGITDIMNLAEEVDNVFERCLAGCACEGGGAECNGRTQGAEGDLERLFTYHTTKIKDKENEDIFPLFEASFHTLEAVREAGGKVLVHCVQGISRSSSVVIAYLMRSRGWSLRKAYDHVKAARSIASPIAWFLLELMRYEATLARDMTLEGYEGKPSLSIDDVYPAGTVMIGHSRPTE